MDHEKPQAVSPQVFDFGGEPTQSSYESEMQYEQRAPSIEEPTQAKERRERRGESVW
jgi:hypothetical protein